MSHETQDEKVGSALIVGGGIGGMQAALDLAAGGIKVYLAETKAAIGGVMSQLDKTFPTNDCAMCTQAPRLVEIGRHKDIDVISLSDIESLRGAPGNFTVTLKKRPRFVDEERCTGCGTCVSNCPGRNSVQIATPVKVEVEPEFKDQVVAIVARHKNRKGPLMPILQEINGALKYFPESVLRYVSQETGTASWVPVEAPEGTAARPLAPDSSVTSTSTVGLPRLSSISRARMSAMALMRRSPPWPACRIPSGVAAASACP